MMINKFAFIVLFTIFSSSFYSQNVDYPRLGVGLQTNFPAGGLSVKADITEQHSAQAVVGLFGPFESYYGRYLYNFNETGSNFLLKPYVYGQVGYWKYDFENIYGSSLKGTGLDLSSSSVGYGVGAGVEFTYPAFSENLRYSIEVGYSKVDLANYNFKSIAFGVGLHYYFNL